LGYLGYARRFRPQTFDEVVGQPGAIGTVRNALEQGRVSHAYLFCGPRGTGKTTTARILARALNCDKGPTPDPCGECDACVRTSQGGSLDVVEMDAASHRGVDDVRELREGVWGSTLGARFRVYIIDEVHMLTTEAFNAFLKVLEEPPEHVKFVLCTTDPQKMPETVRSRCQRLDFRRLTVEDAVARLRQIAGREELEVGDDALREVARHSQGGLRDAEVLLEQLSIYSEGAITLDDVRALTGSIDQPKLAKLAAALAESDAGAALEEADAIVESGADPAELMDALAAHLRDALAVQACGGQSPVVASRGIDLASAGATAERLTQEELLYAAAALQAARKDARTSPQPRIVLELALVRLSRIKDLVSLEDLAESLESGALPDARAPSRRKTPAAPSAPAAPVAEGNAGQPSQRETSGRGGRSAPPGRPAVDDAPADDAPGYDGIPEPSGGEVSTAEGESAAELGPPPPPPEGELTLEAVTERWPFVQAAVTERDVIKGAFLKSGVPSRVEGGDVCMIWVAFPAQYGYHRQRLSDAESLALVAEVASRLLGREVTVRLAAAQKGRVVKGGGASGSDASGSGETGSGDEASTPARARDAARRDPKIQKLIEKSGGRIERVGDE
jgi:DNA polymerase-3 subunit gamma/tau